MSDATTRPAASRGRGSGRGGRGGFAGRGGRRTNGDKADHKADESLGAFDDEGGDIGELRKQYGDKTSMIRAVFPDWSEVDILFALQETNGDQDEAVSRIADGSISQWGEVSKPKKTSRAKTKDNASAPSNNDAASAAPRAARGGRTVSEGGRGRGRASERGGSRGGRGRSAAPTNGTRTKDGQQLSVPTEESSAWGNGKPKDDAADEKEVVAEKPAPTEPPKPAAPPVKTWASMLRQSTTPKAPPKPKEAPTPKPAPAPTPAPETAEPEPEPVLEPTTEPEPEPEPVAAEPETESTPVVEEATPVETAVVVEAEVALPPSKDELTETNLEQVVDDSKPPATGTAASTAADSWDPRQNPGSVTATPILAAQQQHQRPDASGFAATAAKATAERTTRGPSHHQRRILDQEEAVRMPGNREVDRAAVQFGSLNLNGGEDDIDGDREEPETRAQPPADSPIAHPRTSLPPATQPAVPEAFSQKQVTSSVPPIAAPAAPAAAASQAPAPAQPAVPNPQQFGRFGQAGAQDAAAAPQKPLDPFAQQNTPSSQPPFDNFPAQTSQPQQPGAGFSSAPSEYASYYTANQPDRNPYSYYNQHFGQQGAQGQQDAPSQRPFGGYGASQTDNLSQYPQSGALHNQPRFGANDAQNSGTSTPNPTAQAQQQQPQGQQPAQQHAQQGQQQGQQQQQPAQGSQPQSHGQQYPGYNHPYYSNPYYHQYYSGYGHSGFGPYGKGGMYGQPYGVSPNAPYDHTSSPAGFGQSSLHRDSALSSGGLGDYGRAATTQAGSQPGLGGGSTFGSVQDSFARGGASSFQSQGQSFNSQGQPNAAAATDDLKPFGDSKTSSGPSPSIGGARPGSAANNAPAAQSGLPPPQNSQMGGGYGAYPSQLQGHNLHGSGAYGMGANAGGSQHANSPYGSYNQGGFGSGGYYGGNQQQRGGWGGNYH